MILFNTPIKPVALGFIIIKILLGAGFYVSELHIRDRMSDVQLFNDSAEDHSDSAVPE